MGKRLDVLQAVKALAQAAVPLAKVMGLDGDSAAPTIVPDSGRIVVRSGDPELLETTLSPVTYYWEHRIPLEVASYRSSTRTSEEALDDMLTAIGAAIEAHRTLGGLADYLDIEAPETDDLPIYDERGNLVAKPPRVAELILVASYATSGPLS